MRDVSSLIAGVRADLASADEQNRECGIDSSEWVEVRRADVEALLGVAEMRAPAILAAGWSELAAAVRTSGDADV